MTDSYITGFEQDLDNSIYEEQAGKLVFELRDFGKAERTLVIRTMFAGDPTTVMVDWSKFCELFDEMRAGLMSEDWDQALMELMTTGGSND